MRFWPIVIIFFPLVATVAQETSRSPEDRFPEIMQLIQQKRFPAARKIVEQLRSEFPDNAELHLFETAICEGSGHFARCEDLAQEYIEKYPESVNLDQAYYLLGTAQIKGGSREEGFQSLRSAGEITDDPTLQSQIARTLNSILQSSDRVGIHLGGQPPITEEEKAKLCKISLRILRRALEDFNDTHDAYPESLDQLLDGDPPILLALPMNPFSLEGRFEYTRTESGFDLTEPVGEQIP
jgi:tetratricopeptide (TPR) repeat protein